MTEKVKTSFVFHAEWMEAIQDLPAEKGMFLIKIMIDYSCNGIEPDIEDPIIRALFKAFKPRIDSDNATYQASCKRKSEAMKKIWEKREKNKEQCNTIEDHSTVATPCNTIEDHSTLYNTIEEHSVAIDSDTDSDTDTDIIFKKEKNKKEKSKKFIPPTLEEVTAYCQERHNNVDPQKFLDHYESVGWKKSSGTKVVNWQACVRTWENNSNNYNNKAPPKKTPEEIARDFFADIDDEDLWTIKKPKN